MLKPQFLTTACALLIPCGALAADLPLGETVEGRTKENSPADYAFAAEEPGVLMVVVRADEDVVIKVLAATGRPVPDGTIDIDYEGNSGAEQGAIIIGAAGEYTVRIEPYFGNASFVLGATWLPMPAVARKPDPHGTPDDAIALEVGKNLEEVIDAENGDREDWYRFEAQSKGLLNVSTRSEFGDLVLECYKEGALDTIVQRSDDDIGGDTGRESISIDVEQGDVYFFVVTAPFSSEAKYSIRAALISD